jgi:anti-anti-sigma factor
MVSLGEGAMNDTMNNATAPTVVADEFAELVRGNEQPFLERILPLVRRQTVSLDLETVARIDAAGLAALIKLYCAAREAGHGFTVSNPSPRVKEILALVGLDRILLSQNMDKFPYFSARLEETAA